MTDKEAIADTQLIHDALRFLFWAAGQGISPTNTDDAPEPEEALWQFMLRTGDERWETMADRWLVSVTPRSTQAPIP